VTLDAVVVFVGDVHISCGVDRDAGGRLGIDAQVAARDGSSLGGN
jgi:hypothetical protein